MKIQSISQLKETLDRAISNNKTAAIITHVNPDGDGLGSALALQEIYSSSNKKLDIILNSEIPELYSFLQGRKRTLQYNEDLHYDTLIILDCHEEIRLGKCAALMGKAVEIVVIDHHPEKDPISADYYIDPDMVSVGAIIYRLFEQELNNLDPVKALYTAKAIYVSILNDTENFINANTDQETFRICSGLLDLGLVPGEVTKFFLYNKTAREMRYIGEILATIKTFRNGKVVFLNSNLEMLNRNGLDANANSKILRWVKGMDNTEVIVYFSELFYCRERIL